jgi:integrase
LLRFQVANRRESLVLHERPNCTCGCGGGWDEPAARTELGNILARVRVGVWERPAPPPAIAEGAASEGDVPLFGDYAAWWLEAKIAGIIGDHPIAENTISDYRGRLRHLFAFFGPYRLDQIDAEMCLEFKAHLLAEARELREALEKGADIRDGNGRRARPLGPSMIRKVIDALRAILEEAVEDRHIDYNLASGKRMRVKVPRPKRTFLEMDELAYLLDAAADQDAPMFTGSAPADAGLSAAAVADLAAKRLRPKQIAEQLGLSKSTVTYHLRRLGAKVGNGYVGRRVVCEILGRSGVRVGELCDLKIGHARVHDPEGARFGIPDAKTETGIRDVEMSPDLVEAVVEHLDCLRRMGLPSGPDNYLAPNLRGGRLDRKRAGQIVAQAAALASERMAAQGLPPLPRTTPHTLRRTYISIALLANNFDVKWVMGQVGHADSKMTLDVYAQLEQRVDRSHGKSFDRLVNKAREQVKGLSLDPGTAAKSGSASARSGDEVATEPKKRRIRSKRR